MRAHSSPASLAYAVLRALRRSTSTSVSAVLTWRRRSRGAGGADVLTAGTGGLHLESADVVIVGAGISGLAVGESLTRHGVTTRILEARSRTGGRLLGRPADLGASWFWDGEQRVADLARRFSVGTFPQYRAGDALIDDLTGVHRLSGNPIDVPAQRFAGGAASLADALSKALPAEALLLDSPVEQISDNLVVASRGRHWRARHVVLAAPPAVAVRTMQLPPALDQRTLDVARATPVWMGHAVKVVARFNEPFWRAEGLAGAGMSRVGPLQEIHDLCGPGGEPAMLFGFTGPSQMNLDAREAICAQLARMFGPRAAEPLSVTIQDWSRERWTNPGGAGSAPGSPAPTAPDYGLFGHPAYRESALGGRLHWSSTETAVSHAGHVEGALEAAERTCRAILADLR